MAQSVLPLGTVIQGSGKVLALFNGMSRRSKRGRRFWQRAAIFVHREVIGHFRDETGPDGPWKPWAASTKAARKRGRGGNKILQDEGTLMGSIVFTASERSALIKTVLDYAATHQEGDREKNIPARPFMFLPRDKVRRIRKAYSRFIRTGRARI